MAGNPSKANARKPEEAKKAAAFSESYRRENENIKPKAATAIGGEAAAKAQKAQRMAVET